MKRAKGGQVEIEFIAQYLQLTHASTHPEILDPNTAASLNAAAHLKLLAPADSETLLSALAFYQRLTHILRLCIDGEFKPESAPKHLLQTLSQVAEQPDISSTEAYLAETQEKVAEIFKKILNLS